MYKRFKLCRPFDREVSPSWLSPSWSVAQLTVAQMVCRPNDRNSNFGPILHFSELRHVLSAPDPTPIQPWFRGCSRCTRSPMLGVNEAERAHGP